MTVYMPASRVKIKALVSPLHSQVAVVTGSGRGIGKAIALALAASGARLCLVGRDRKALEKVRLQARDCSPKIMIHECDLTTEGALESLAKTIERTFGRVHILIHSAGTYCNGSIERTPVGELDRLYQINVRAPYRLTQLLLPMLKSSQGQIVFVNSTAGLEAKANVGPFAATQYAFRAIADALREEVNTDRIRVLSLFLGRVATPRARAIFRSEGTKYPARFLLQAEDVASILINVLSMECTAHVMNLQMRSAIKAY